MIIKQIEVNCRIRTAEFEYDDVKILAELETSDLEEVKKVRGDLISLARGESKSVTDTQETAKKEKKSKVKEDVKEPEQLPLQEVNQEETKVEETKEDAPKEEKKKKATSTKKPKEVAYDRTLDVHKKELGKVFDNIDPAWRKKHMDIAKELSEKFVGVPFIDSKGEVLDSFKEKISEEFKSRI